MRWWRRPSADPASANFPQHNKKSSMKKHQPKTGPVDVVRYKSVSIPIYRGDTTKKGKIYRGFRFSYEENGKMRWKRAKTLDEIREIARSVAEAMLWGTFSATTGTLILTGSKLSDYQALMDFEAEVGDVVAFVADAVRAHRVVSKIPKATLLDAASHYASSLSTLRPMTVKMAALCYLARKRHQWSPGYFRRAKMHLRYFVDQFGSRQIRDITMSDIENFVNTYPRRVAAAKAARKALLKSSVKPPTKGNNP